MAETRSFEYGMPWTIVLDPEDVERCRGFGHEMELYGPSHVYTDPTVRRIEGQGNQFTAAIGEFVGSCLVLGMDAGREAYTRAREAHRVDPWKGDGGSDMLSIENVDFKASVWSPGRNPLDHHLYVRPEEYHPDTVYVFILVGVLASGAVRARVMGWTLLYEADRTEYPTRIAQGDRYERLARYLMQNREAPLRVREREGT